MSSSINNLYKFDKYTLNAKERNLWQDNELVQMPPKVFDTLCLLVENQGKILSKEQMLTEIWQDTFVEENNLSQNISTLRKIFGQDNNFIETIPRRGFRFTEPVKIQTLEQSRQNQTNANGSYFVATQTKTDIVEETIVEDEYVKTVPKTIEQHSGLNLKTIGGIFFALLTASVFGFLTFNFFSSDKKEKRSIPTANFDFIELTDTGNINSSVISPDGQFVAFIKSSDDWRLDTTSLHLLEVESGNDVTINIENGIIPGFLQFSSDGKYIYFRTRGKLSYFQNVYKVSRFGGLPELIVKDMWGYFSLSPDGRKMTYFARNAENTKHRLIIRDLESKTEEIILERPADKGFYVPVYPIFSPDGEKLVYVHQQNVSFSSDFTVLDLKTKEEEIIKTNFTTVGKTVWHPDGKSLYLLANEKGKQFQIWNLSYPEKQLTRVTSDSNAYRSLHISADGKILSVNRLDMFSNLWVLPEGKLENAKQLTFGENEHGGLLTLQFASNDTILFNGRKANEETIWKIDLEGTNRQRLTENKIGVEHNFGTANQRNAVFYEFDKQIFRQDLDTNKAEPLNLGEGESFAQPAVSYDGKWLFYVKRDKQKTTIWKKSLETDEQQFVTECVDYSPENFLTASPDGKYLAFVYVTPKQFGDDTKSSRNTRKYGFMNLETKEVKVFELSAYRSILRWSNGGKSFDYPSFTENGSAILRQNIENNSPPKKILELKKEYIYRFDWSPDGKTLAIGRGNYRMDLVLLRPEN